MTLPLQRSFDEMGAHLSEVPFCVVDLETTGGSARDCAITEIGAVRYLGGELEGTFQTLVNPGLAIPPQIVVLTGITQMMVIEAPPIDEAFPAFLEFLGDAIVVGHNVRFDLSFLHAAGKRLGYGPLPHRSVDTVGLARRLVRSEVRNLRLATLAAHFRSPVTPTHRALDDARATAHVLWGLLERAGTVGVTHLEDLLALPTARGAPHYRKLELTDRLPRRPGVYLFRDRHDEIIYVGKAKNLRTRVRSYFYGDTRRSVATMLRELDRIEHRVCATELEAEVTELRLIAEHGPRHNRRGRKPRSSHWVKVTDEPFPRLSIARSARTDGLALLGPFRGRRAAVRVVEAIWDATPIRRCRGRPGARSAPCAPAQLGKALCPCDGALDPTRYRRIVETLLEGIDGDCDALLSPLADRVAELAADRRYEEAAWVRDRHRALTTALERRRAWRSMQAAGLLHAADATGCGAIIDRGRLLAAWEGSDGPPLAPPSPVSEVTEVPTSVADAEEAHLVWKWLAGDAVTLLDVTGTFSTPSRPVERLEKLPA